MVLVSEIVTRSAFLFVEMVWPPSLSFIRYVAALSAFLRMLCFSHHVAAPIETMFLSDICSG